MLYYSLPYSSEFIVVVVKYNLIVLTADFHVRLPSERANENSDYLPASHTYHLHVIKHEKLLYPEIHMVTAVNPRAHPVAPCRIYYGYVSRRTNCGAYPPSLSSTLLAATSTHLS